MKVILALFILLVLVFILKKVPDVPVGPVMVLTLFLLGFLY